MHAESECESNETRGAASLDVAIFAAERRVLHVCLASLCLSKFTDLQESADPIGLLVECIVDVCSKAKSTKPREASHKDLLVCSMCKNIFFDAITVACGHTYCRTCIGDKPTFPCPTCGVCSANGLCHPNVVISKCVDKAHPLESEKRKIRSSGNAFMSRQEYEKAVDEYSEGLKLDKDDHLLLGNRALAFLSQGNLYAALVDARRVAVLRPFWPKGFYRMAVAQKQLKQFPEAALNYFISLCIDQSIPQARKGLQECLTLCFADQKVENMVCKLSDQAKFYLELFQADKFALLCKMRDTKITEWFESLLPKKTSSVSRKRDISASFDDISTCEIERKRARTSSFVGDENHYLPRPFPELSYPSIFCIDDFECCLCFQMLLEPVTPPCGHSFCRHCLDRCLDYSPQCPLCKDPLLEYLAERRSATSELMIRIMKWCWPEECAARRKHYEEELRAAASAPASGESLAELPIFICMLPLPGVPCPLHVFEPRYRLMMRRSVESGSRQFGMTIATEGPEPFLEVGTILLIRDIRYLPDGRSFVDTIGNRRFKVRQRGMRDSYHTASVDLIRDDPLTPEQREALMQLCQFFYQRVKAWFDSLRFRPQIFNQIVESYGTLPAFDGHDGFSSADGPIFLWWVIAIFQRSPYQQYELLKSRSVEERLRSIMNVFTNVLRAENA